MSPYSHELYDTAKSKNFWSVKTVQISNTALNGLLYIVTDQ